MDPKQPDETKSPFTELPKLSYEGFASAAVDERTPSLASERKILQDIDIKRGNLAPERVCVYIDQGTIIQLRRSMWDEVPLLCLLVLSVCLVFYVTARLPESPSSFPAQAFGPLVIAALIAHRRWNSKYFIQKEGVTIVKGLLNPINFSRLQCQYNKIKVVEVAKNLLQRLLGVGDIRISTALVDRPEMSLDGIVNPYFYVSVINLLLKNQQNNTLEEESKYREPHEKRPKIDGFN